jgi:ADP-heptose:LPS heptosyltransferase
VTLDLLQRAPGDVLVAGRLVAALHRQDPDREIVLNAPRADEIFKLDPRVRVDPNARADLTVNYQKTVDRAMTGDASARYLRAAIDSYESQTGERLPEVSLLPEIALAPDEPTVPIDGPYWVLAAGSKWDMPVKQAPHTLFEGLVRETPDTQWVQVGGIGGDPRSAHRQVAVEGALNLIGATKLRSLFAIIARSSGVVCHLSLPMLVAAAFRVPCVVLAGGREPASLHRVDPAEWPTFSYLGASDRFTCAVNGCRRRFAAPAHGVVAYPQGYCCDHPVEDAVYGSVAGCLADIGVGRVVHEVRRLQSGAVALPVR